MHEDVERREREHPAGAGRDERQDRQGQRRASPVHGRADAEHDRTDADDALGCAGDVPQLGCRASALSAEDGATAERAEQQSVDERATGESVARHERQQRPDCRREQPEDGRAHQHPIDAG